MTAVQINADYVPHHDWMAFLLWYSLSKNLPDTPVTVSCRRGVMRYPDLFRWPARVGCGFKLHKGDPPAAEFCLPPDVVMVRPPDEADGLTVGDVREESAVAFVSYRDGWGNFVTSSWINKEGHPLCIDGRYEYGSSTTNEARVARLWRAAAGIFPKVRA